MNLQEYISRDKISISKLASIKQIIDLFEQVPYTHLPIVDNHKLIGTVAKEDLHNLTSPHKSLAEHGYLIECFFSKAEDTLLELFSNFAINNSNMMPVLDSDLNYNGYFDLNDLLDCFADTYFLHSEGSILLLEKATSDYSMSEIVQIVETNQSEVLGCFISYKNEEKTQVVLKTNQENINEIIQSFRRYEYTIINDLSDDSYLESLKKRSEYFIKYLNI
ncbi:CBS domain-containing protein [Flavobacteriaceae bacterium]|nr:CBS domain-containing protein [Flavobacteriaceae bacterium]